MVNLVLFVLCEVARCGALFTFCLIRCLKCVTGGPCLVLGLPRWRRDSYPVSILHKSIAGRYRPVRVADGLITARYIFM